MISNERYDQLLWLWENEDPDDESWLDELTEEELALIGLWDHTYLTGIRNMIKAGRQPFSMELMLNGEAIVREIRHSDTNSALS